MITNFFFDNFIVSPDDVYEVIGDGRVSHLPDDDGNLDPVPDSPSPSTAGSDAQSGRLGHSSPTPSESTGSIAQGSSDGSGYTLGDRPGRAWSLGANTDFGYGIRAENRGNPDNDFSIDFNYNSGKFSFDTSKGMTVMLGEGVEYGVYINPLTSSYDLCLAIGVQAGQSGVASLAEVSAGACAGTTVMVYASADVWKVGVSPSYELDYIGIARDYLEQMSTSFDNYMLNYISISNMGSSPY